MYSTIETYWDGVISTVNTGITGTTNDFRKIDTEIDGDLPTDLSDKSYRMRFFDLGIADDIEERPERVGVEIDLWFEISNDVTNYKNALDTHIRKIKQELKKFRPIESTTYNIYKMDEVNFKDLNKLVNGNYLNPKLTFYLFCVDKS